MKETLVNKKRDLIIIGGGAGGLVVASVASQLGLNVTLIENQDTLGGDCLHYGCVPSKTLIKTADVAAKIQYAERFGLPTGKIHIDLAKVMQHVQQVVTHIQQHDEPQRFRDYGCDVIFGTAKFYDAKNIEVNKHLITAKRFVIASGSQPNIPLIPGLQEINFLTNETIFQLQILPKHLIILGAGAMGLEMAQVFARLGSKVSVVDITQRIMPIADERIATQLQEFLQAEGVSFHFVNKIVDIKEQKAQCIVNCLTQTNGSIHLKGNQLFVATGRKANIDKLNLAAARIDFSSRGIIVNERLQTSQKHIYALGDAIESPYKMTHCAEYQAGVIISNAVFHIRKKINYQTMPAVVFTDPEFATVGITERQVQEQKLNVNILRCDFKDIDRALAEVAPTGSIKLTIHKQKIIGATILGLHAGELLAEVTLAMQARLNIRYLLATVHVYPTLSQIIRRAVNTYYAPTLFSKKTKWLVKCLNRIF
ncbi:MAG: FAD-dependent oxidoreductase [Gammaproteobacteria bacterium]|nr:FAD-dependent oxidoreductase [Gammaproteobacteria bacterium]